MLAASPKAASKSAAAAASVREAASFNELLTKGRGVSEAKTVSFSNESLLLTEWREVLHSAVNKDVSTAFKMSLIN